MSIFYCFLSTKVSVTVNSMATTDKEVVIKAQRHSCFNCRLNPERTDLLINGYCNERKPDVAMDIIKIIILYFNHIIYWNPKHFQFDQSLPVDSGGTDDLDTPGSFFRRLNLHRRLLLQNCHDDYYTLRLRYNSDTDFGRCPIYMSRTNIDLNSLSNEFKFMIQMENSEYCLELVDAINLKHDITQIIVRSRIFCVETNCEMEKTILFRPSCMKRIQISNYKELGIKTQLLETCEDINIGIEIDILHIVYDDYSYWSMNHYSWIKEIIYPKICITDSWDDNYLRYCDSGCFKVNDKYYYLFDNYDRRKILMKFVGFYCKEFKQLPYDIILIKRNDSYISLFECVKYDLEIAIKERNECEHQLIDIFGSNECEQIIKMAIKLSIQAQNRKHQEKLMEKLSKPKFNSNKSNKYSHKNKMTKMNKVYRNNKKKYKYHRW